MMQMAETLKLNFKSVATWGLLLSLLILLTPLMGIPPFRFGYYVQVEPVMCYLWLMGGLSALWTFVLVKQKPRFAAQIWSMPIVWGWLPIIVLSGVTSLFRPIPLQSWTGSGQIGEGVLTFLSEMFITFVFVALIKIKSYRKLLLIMAVLTGTIMSLLTIIGSFESPFESYRNWTWAPIFFPDWIAFFAVSLIVFYWVCRKDFRHKWPYHFIMLSIIAVVSYYASNKSLGYGAAIALGVVVALEIPVFKKITYETKFFLSFLGLTLGLTLFLIFYDVFGDYISQNPMLKVTLESRTYLNKIVLIDFFYQPFGVDFLTQLFFGMGWGRYSDALAANVFLIKEIFMYHGQKLDPNWEFLKRDLLHSHNSISEHFLALGGVGLSIFYTVKYFVIRSMNFAHHRLAVFFLLTLTIVGIFWFQLVLTLPFVLLASAMIFQRRCILKFLRLKPRSLKIMGGVGGIVLMSWSFFHLGFTMNLGKNVRLDPQTKFDEIYNEYMVSPGLQYDNYIGGRRSIALGRSLVNELFIYLKKNKNLAPEALMQTHIKIISIAQLLFNEVTHSGNFYAVIVPMNIFSEAAYNPQIKHIFEANPKLAEVWGQMAGYFVKVLPKRSDILVPLFNYLLVHHEQEKVRDLTRELLSYNSEDAVALWFLGLVELTDSSTYTKGVCRLKQAFRNGLTRTVPIPQAEMDQINKLEVFCKKTVGQE
jgi:hypothetical protein